MDEILEPKPETVETPPTSTESEVAPVESTTPVAPVEPARGPATGVRLPQAKQSFGGGRSGRGGGQFGGRGGRGGMRRGGDRPKSEFD